MVAKKHDTYYNITHGEFGFFCCSFLALRRIKFSFVLISNKIFYFLDNLSCSQRKKSKLFFLMQNLVGRNSIAATALQIVISFIAHSRMNSIHVN